MLRANSLNKVKPEIISSTEHMMIQLNSLRSQRESDVTHLYTSKNKKPYMQLNDNFNITERNQSQILTGIRSPCKVTGQTSKSLKKMQKSNGQLPPINNSSFGRDLTKSQREQDLVDIG